MEDLFYFLIIIAVLAAAFALGAWIADVADKITRP